VLLGAPDLSRAVAAFASELAAALGADRVSVGILSRAHIDIMAMSPDADLNSRGELVRAVTGAMEEAVTQGDTVTYPSEPTDRPRIIVAHAKLGRYSGTAILTVPLISAGKTIGALTLERRLTPLSKAETALCEHIACLASPLLELHRRAERRWWSRASDSLRDTGRTSRWVAAAAVIAAAAGLAWVPVPHRVGAPARIEGAVQRIVSAPTDGFLKAIHVRPGDEVRSGELLVELADRELTLEQQKWESAVTQHENSYGAALARGDRAEFVISRARAAEAEAELQLVEQHLARARLSAPIDGIVIKGDLGQALGAPVERGEALLTIAPRDQYRVVVEIDESDIAAIHPGQQGRLALSASPTDTLPISVTRVTAVAAVHDGHNTFEVEARLHPGAVPLRPGLQGIAKIETGTRALGWIWTHRLTDWLRLAVWSRVL
jgi:biotin carboxyl carrier protein